MPVTLKEIAAAAGVAPNTVSTVLNGKQNWTSEKTRKRVIEVAERLGYTPNRLARGLRLGTYSTVGLVIPDLLNPYYASFARSLEKALNENGYDLLIEDSEASITRERNCLSRFSERQIDGLVCSLMAPSDCQTLLESLLKMGRPVICIGRPPKGLKVDAFRSDFSQGISEVISYLKGLGHTRIAFVSGLPEGQFEDGERFRFFKALLKAEGLSFSDRLFIKCGHTMASAKHAFTEFWQSSTSLLRPTAVMALNDILAIGVMRSCLDMGLQVPDDISITGIDNTDIAENLPIRLTSIALPHEQMAKRAANRLMDRFNSRLDSDQFEEVVMPTKLVVRESTALKRS